MFALSSRTSTTSSSTGPSATLGTLAGSSRSVSAGPDASPTVSRVNIDQRCQSASSPAPAGVIQSFRPKTSVTASPRIEATVPLGRSQGSWNQSLL